MPIPGAYLLSLVSLFFACSVFAQDYTIPSNWQNAVSNVSRAERRSAAWGAANEVQRKVDPTLGIPQDNIFYETGANMAIAFALQDYRSGNSSWRKQVLGNTLALYEAGRTTSGMYNENSTRDISFYGLAEATAYLAYNDSARLDVAKGNFDIVYNDFINMSDAQHDKHPRKFNTPCGPALGGLLFENRTNATDLTVYTSGIGPWVTLGARLAELTGNATYLSAAEQSILFMDAHMINANSASAVISDRFNVTSCTVVAGVPPLAWDIGPYIEGLSIVANMTQNSTYTEMLNDLVPAVVVIPEWHDSNGVLVEDTQYSLKGTIIRGLLEARLRNPSNAGMIALIDSYITLQYNAAAKSASIGNNDYKLSWIGNETAEYTTPGNLAALDMLNAMFAIAPADNSSNATGSAESSSTTSTPIGAIVGGTIGGIAAASALALALYIYLRRRRRARDPTRNMDIPGAPRSALAPEPFIQATPTAQVSLGWTAEKGGYQPRVPHLHELNSNSASNSLTSPSVDAVSDTSLAQLRPAASDPDALQALERSLMLERRLDNLISTLANQGETESSPPEYDGNVNNHA
ncbi:hypothetical protein PENSPDRAFT_687481 [Peniophora sp. CONT]|nr:hypothetical protein PENSPDRAFT_687481 [Peniophora sp. CONT]